MSILSATMVCTALLGADPNVAVSETGFANVTTQNVIAVHCEEQAACATTTHCADVGGVCQNNGCSPANGCQNGGRGKSWCPWGDDDCDDDDCDLCCWDRHLLNYCVGPGNMHPHYPYMPVYHGYYYFRPYNYMHVAPDSALAAQMGGEPLAPYSVEFLRDVFPRIPADKMEKRQRERLPILEELLNSPKLYTE